MCYRVEKSQHNALKCEIRYFYKPNKTNYIMTRIEMETMSLIKAACCEYIDNQRGKEIDWEQRRYEIARELYANNRDASAENCVAWADRLIEALRAKKGGDE